MFKMATKNFMFSVFLVLLRCISCDCIFLIVPEDVSTGLAAVYGFSPRIVKGNDHRVGFGFRFGNHADFQVMYELGPQLYTKPPIRVRSASYSSRVVRRRPLLELLLRLGILDLHQTSYQYDVVHADCDQPR